MKNGKHVFITAALILALLAPIITTQAKTSDKIRFVNKKVTLQVGSKKKLSLNASYKSIKWKSSKKKVATVSKKGVVKALKVGTAKITAIGKYGKAVCVVKVIKKTSEEVINKSGKDFSLGATDSKKEKAGTIGTGSKSQQPQKTPGPMRTPDPGLSIPPVTGVEQGGNEGTLIDPYYSGQDHVPGTISLSFSEPTDIETLYSILEGVEIEKVKDSYKDAYESLKNNENADQESLDLLQQNIGLGYKITLKDKSDETLYKTIEMLKANPLVKSVNDVKVTHPNN